MNDVQSGGVSYDSSSRGTLSDSHSSSGNLDSSESTASSILQPISVNDARSRSYLVGSIGCKVSIFKGPTLPTVFCSLLFCEDSLLGSDELYRYFPNGKMRILAVTWNMSSQPPPNEMNDLLLPESIGYLPDLYAIGVQEAPTNHDMKEWGIQMQTTIGPSHVMLHSCTLGVLHLAIFLRRDLIWFTTVPEDASFSNRSLAANLIKTKGAVAISFCFFGTSLLFINCHLPAHESRVKERIEAIDKICTTIDLPQNLLPLKPRYVSKNVSGRYDCVFWMGDLNFRVERPCKEVMEILEEIKHQSNPSMESLLQHDQLVKMMESGKVLHGFYEASTVHFPPTYKFIIGSSNYDCQNQRVPSFTDRILFRSKVC